MTDRKEEIKNNGFKTNFQNQYLFRYSQKIVCKEQMKERRNKEIEIIKKDFQAYRKICAKKVLKLFYHFRLNEVL